MFVYMPNNCSTSTSLLRVEEYKNSVWSNTACFRKTKPKLPARLVTLLVFFKNWLKNQRKLGKSYIITNCDMQVAVVAEAMSLVDLGKRLLESAKLGETEEVRHLMTNGAPFTTDWLGTSPLHMAAQFGHLSTAEVLIRAGISRDARTKVDRTPLHIAAQEGHLDIVELLIRSGADIEAKDMLKMTPLHWAVERSHIPVIEILLRNGADVNSLSKFEKTPIDIAFDNGHAEIVEILQSADRLREEGPLVCEEVTSEPSKEAKEAEIVPLVSQQEEVQTSCDSGTKNNPIKPILLQANISNVNKSSSRDSLSDSESPDQSSTSVLATLAALAEATAPLAAHAATNVSAAEALQWLETHGITMLPADNSTIVASALESGQTISLTEAGKLALNWARKQNCVGTEAVETSQESAVDSVIQNVVGNVSNQKVITIVTDQNQLPSIVSGAGAGPILVAMTNSDIAGTESITLTQDDGESEPAAKKLKTNENETDLLDREELEQRLEEARRKAEEYKEQLRVKEHEAEEYRLKLEAIAQQNKSI